MALTQVETGMIKDASVTTAKLADSTVTPAKLTQPLTAGTTVASTSGTSIDFTSIPSWVKRITVMFNSVSTSGTSLVQVQIGAGSVTTTGYASNSSVMGSGGTASSSSTTGFLLDAGTPGAATVRNGTLTILNQTGNTWVSSVAAARTDSYGLTGGGFIALGGALDRVRITTVNGTDTFDAGSINILYE